MPNLKCVDGTRIYNGVSRNVSYLATYQSDGYCYFNDDKLVVTKDGRNYTDDQIRALTEFQEKYFESVIVRCCLSTKLPVIILCTHIRVNTTTINKLKVRY